MDEEEEEESNEEEDEEEEEDVEEKMSLDSIKIRRKGDRCCGTVD